MELWHYLLFFIAALLIALLLGTSIAYLRIRFGHKDDELPFFQVFYLLFRINAGTLRSDQVMLPATDKATPVTSLVISPSIEKAPPAPSHVIPPSTEKATPATSEPSKSPTGPELVEFLPPDLASEFEYNFKSASRFSGEYMLPLLNKAWNSYQDSTHRLPAYLRGELEQVYNDIATLNNLVWLSSELDSQSSSLADYQELLARIVRRSQSIKNAVASGFLR